MLHILSIAMIVTEEMLDQLIEELAVSYNSVVYVRASDVAFHIDARTASAMTQAEYNDLIKAADARLHPKRVAHFAAAYGN